MDLKKAKDLLIKSVTIILQPGLYRRYCIYNNIFTAAVEAFLLTLFYLEIFCPKPSRIRTRIVDYSNVFVTVGTVASFSCATGYYLDGVETVSCDENGHWSDEIPVCIGTIHKM